MESLDEDFCELFYKVLKKHLTDSFSIESVKSIKKLLPEIRKKFKAEKVKKSLVHSFPSQISVSKFQNSAYFYECSMCLASSTAKTFLELTEKNVEFFDRKMARKAINICCIAGVLASEAVAVVKVLVNKIGNEEKNYTNFHLTFVNADDKWETVTTAVLQELKEHIGERYRAKVTPRFVVEDPRELSLEVLEIFQGADILLATKLSQELCKVPDKEFKHLLLTAFHRMKADSILFFADFSSANFIKVLDSEASKLDSLHCIYKETCVFHSLSLETIESHLGCYREHFGKDLSSSYCFLSMSAWLKFDRKFATKEESSGAATNIPQHKLAKQKKAARKNFCSFNKTVENMCDKEKSVAMKKSVKSEELKSVPEGEAVEIGSDEGEILPVSVSDETEKMENLRSNLGKNALKKSVKGPKVTIAPNYEPDEHASENLPVNISVKSKCGRKKNERSKPLDNTVKKVWLEEKSVSKNEFVKKKSEKKKKSKPIQKFGKRDPKKK